ncbi:hypothetical protein F7725_019364 [Dissostichus mawsoni]|uniref:Uncharacterized protein n=1 Tax=Dissostichus mawsoni TaxID=36200 RepID=A0A7J5YJK9_DISMA|nr:hypothetical protein F7725_019364 [Dissostichus mawsoni]
MQDAPGLLAAFPIRELLFTFGSLLMEPAGPPLSLVSSSVKVPVLLAALFLRLISRFFWFTFLVVPSWLYLPSLLWLYLPGLQPLLSRPHDSWLRSSSGASLASSASSSSPPLIKIPGFLAAFLIGLFPGFFCELFITFVSPLVLFITFVPPLAVPSWPPAPLIKIPGFLAAFLIWLFPGFFCKLFITFVPPLAVPSWPPAPLIKIPGFLAAFLIWLFPGFLCEFFITSVSCLAVPSWPPAPLIKTPGFLAAFLIGLFPGFLCEFFITLPASFVKTPGFLAAFLIGLFLGFFCEFFITPVFCLVVPSRPPAALLPLFFLFVLVSLLLLVTKTPGFLAALVFWDFSFFLNGFQESFDVFHIGSLRLRLLGLTYGQLSMSYYPLSTFLVQWGMFNP